MIDLVKTKIESLSYKDRNSISELKKLAGIANFVIQDEGRNISPTPEEFSDAMGKISEAISLSTDNYEYEKLFSQQKDAMLKALNELEIFLESSGLKNRSMSGMLHGQKYVTLTNELDFALLMVEQNNLDYFIQQPSDRYIHDRLAYHMWTRYNQPIFEFGFIDSDLPQKIKDDVTMAFESWKQWAAKQ
ncbi:hypothetical protein FRZ67_15095 [Panacibacter ginsenosidivorans]|uniref:Uncharacterized protein n=1 Tax=Panacibacter ginsenosidivorans TaxID=1813871 RepID=A0A5B8VE70_9BACT|nr:hypothetical protein [Panacibacter ginsenosidivorans]QEC68568.1 hypothetical protein FRZ67_15095 [Panacibacter ginsenosidivorans]